MIYFEEAKKGVIISRTLAEQIAQAVSSDDTDDWPGKKITLYPQPMRVAGRDVVAIRAKRANGGQQPPASLTEEDEDEPPAPEAADDF